jgi:hypothetical protein
MDRGKAISLNSLTLSHGNEIDMMVASIHGNPDRTLWTAQMRAAIRGGKVMGTSLIEESSLEETD